MIELHFSNMKFNSNNEKKKNFFFCEINKKYSFPFSFIFFKKNKESKNNKDNVLAIYSKFTIVNNYYHY